MNPHQDDQAGPLFITEEIEAEMIAAGHVFEPPAHVSTTNIRELYGWQTGETLADAITRHQAEQVGKVRALTPGERAELRQDMAESSAWMRAELARRREGKKQP